MTWCLDMTGFIEIGFFINLVVIIIRGVFGSFILGLSFLTFFRAMLLLGSQLARSRLMLC